MNATAVPPMLKTFGNFALATLASVLIAGGPGEGRIRVRLATFDLRGAGAEG